MARTPAQWKLGYVGGRLRPYRDRPAVDDAARRLWINGLNMEVHRRKADGTFSRVEVLTAPPVPVRPAAAAR